MASIMDGTLNFSCIVLLFSACWVWKRILHHEPSPPTRDTTVRSHFHTDSTADHMVMEIVGGFREYSHNVLKHTTLNINGEYRLESVIGHRDHDLADLGSETIMKKNKAKEEEHTVFFMFEHQTDSDAHCQVLVTMQGDRVVKRQNIRVSLEGNELEPSNLRIIILFCR